MALCSDCTARIEYQGNGSQIDYTFPFEYHEESEIHVSVFDPASRTWVNLTQYTDWTLFNPTTIRLDNPTKEKIVIYRCTDLHPMRATFQPGTSIKAGDLNDNFDQLRNAIEEANCLGEQNFNDIIGLSDIYLNRIEAGTTSPEGIKGDLVKAYTPLTIDDEHVATTAWIDYRYWDQCEETTFARDTWVDDLDDRHIPTTKAVEQRLADFQALSGVKKVTGNDQRDKKWDFSVTDDEHIATTDALVERYDTRVSDTGAGGHPYQQPGKFWVKDDENLLFYRRDTGSAWIQINTKGDKGDTGDDSTVPGPPGEAATILVRSTITTQPGTQANVVNVGDINEAILDFYIPRGEKGEPGDAVGEILDFTKPLVKTGTTVSLDLLILPNVP